MHRKTVTKVSDRIECKPRMIKYWLENPKGPKSTTIKLTIANIVMTLLTSQLEMSWLKEDASENCDKGVSLNEVQTTHDQILTTDSKRSQVYHNETYHSEHINDTADVPTGNVLIEGRCTEKLWQRCQVESSANHVRLNTDYRLQKVPSLPR